MKIVVDADDAATPLRLVCGEIMEKGSDLTQALFHHTRVQKLELFKGMNVMC